MMWQKCRFAIAVILTIQVLSACAISEKRKERAQLRLNIGVNLLANGSYHSALEELLAAEADNPYDPVVQNNLGLTYLVLERPQLAYEHINKAVELAPSYTEAWNNLARVEIELHRYGKAVEHLKRVIADLTYPNPEKAWVNMGLVYFSQRNYAQALQPLRKAIELDRKNCMAHNYFGRSQFELDKYSEAAKSLDQAAKVCQSLKFDEPQYYSALTYYKLGQKEQALARIQELLALYPNGKYNEKALAMQKLME